MTNTSSQSTSVRLSGTHLLWALIAIAPVLRLFSLLGENSFWGVNHAAFESWIWVAVVSALVIAGLFWILRLNCTEQFWSFAETTRGQLVFSSVALALFYFAGTDTHLFSSGLEQIGNLTQRAVPFIDQYSAGATKLHWAAYNLISGVTDRALNDASIAVRIVAAVSGAISIYLWLQISTILTPIAQKRSLIASSLALTGALLLFFGNGAFFAPAALIVTIFIWLAIRLIQAQSTKVRAVYFLALVAVTLTGHWYQAQLLLLVPALIFVTGLGFFPGKMSERVWGIVALVSLVGVVFAFYFVATDDLWVAARLMHIGGKAPEFDYALFSWDRIIDLVNSSLALWPLAPLVFWLIIRYIWSERCDHIVGFLGMLSLSSVTWMIISDFPGGAPREIVTLAPFAIAPAALAGYLFSKQTTALGAQSHKIISAVTIWSFLIIVPVSLLGDNCSAYLDHDLQSRPGRYRSGLVNFRDHNFFIREFRQADYWEQVSSAKAPEMLDMSTVQEQLLKGHLAAGMNRAEFLITSHPYWEEPYGALASGLRATGKAAQALPIVRKALELNPPFETHIVIEGDIYRDLKQYSVALSVYDRAIRYYPKSPLSRSRAALLLAGLKREDEALKHAYLIFEDDPKNPYSYLIVAMIAAREGDFKRSRDYMTMVTPYAAKLPERELINQLLTLLREEQAQSN